MANVLHAKHYADRALQRTVTVVENRRLAQDTYRTRFRCPEIARLIVPGQFLMLRLAGFDDPLIGRPLALYDTIDDEAGRPVGIDVVYLVKGKFTTRLARVQPGQALEVWGPLGNGFPPTVADQLVMVAGGIGQTPFMALSREYLDQRSYGDQTRHARASQVTLLYGARTAKAFAEVEQFRALGIDVRLATDDGTLGHHGLVTDLLVDLLSESSSSKQIACCGPEPMMAAVARIAEQASVPCQVSLETPMACGVGICFTCVAKIREASGDWDYKRTCVDGPVFDSTDIEW